MIFTLLCLCESHKLSSDLARVWVATTQLTTSRSPFVACSSIIQWQDRQSSLRWIICTLPALCTCTNLLCTCKGCKTFIGSTSARQSAAKEKQQKWKKQLSGRNRADWLNLEITCRHYSIRCRLEFVQFAIGFFVVCESSICPSIVLKVMKTSKASKKLMLMLLWGVQTKLHCCGLHFFFFSCWFPQCSCCFCLQTYPRFGPSLS